jgi:Flp pilus assembly protein TadG
LKKHFNNQFEVILARSSCRRCKDFSMPSPAAPKNSVRNILRRFRRSRAGSAAVEFALVAPVFFALLFAIIEVAIMFFASQVLETITQDSARALMTGQAQTGLVAACANPVSGAPAACTQSSFQAYACSQIPALFSCPNLYVDVESYSSFSGIVINSQIDGSGNFTSTNMQYNPGGPGDVVIVRMFYQWPLFVTGFGFNMSNLSGNKRLLVATSAFQNEPY